jgi:hypothetical protein
MGAKRFSSRANMTIYTTQNQKATALRVPLELPRMTLPKWQF